MKNLAYNGETLTDNAEGNTVGSREGLSRIAKTFLDPLTTDSLKVGFKDERWNIQYSPHTPSS